MSDGTIRLLTVNDVHVSDTPPRHRTDSYKDDILNKLREIVQISIDVKATHVLFMGDIFHHKEPRRVSHKLVQELIQIFKSFKVPVAIVVGNHDITHNRLESLSKQPLGVLGEYVTLLTKDPFICSTEDEGEVTDRLAIYPLPGIIPDIKVEDYKVEKVEDVKWHIVASHQSVVPDIEKEPFFLKDNESIHDAQAIADITNVNFVLYGHQHRCDGIYRKGNVVFSNLGSICRGTIGDEDLKKEPAVLLLTLPAEGTPKATTIKLKCVKPVETSYNLDAYEGSKQYKQDIALAVERLKNSPVESKLTIEDLIETVEVRTDIEETTRAQAVNLLEHVK